MVWRLTDEQLEERLTGRRRAVVPNPPSILEA